MIRKDAPLLGVLSSGVAEMWRNHVWGKKEGTDHQRTLVLWLLH
jgi:hypothetical protein